jgi:UDP-N-acetylmuramate: L-alanyl-gamma-D-glutamyl-meso-diaminopimelate ligase
VDRLAREISAGGPAAHACGTVEEMVQAAAASARPGDVVVAMSNGSFGGIWDKLLAALQR